MKLNDLKSRVPGYIATGLLVLTTSLWTLWGTIELYYEGWGAALPPAWLYLIPALIFLSLSLFSLTWPHIGGWLLIASGSLFIVWWSMMAVGSDRLSFSGMLTTLPISSMLIITGIFLLKEARYRQRHRGFGRRPQGIWHLRNLGYLLILGISLLVFVGVSAYYLPQVLRRVDDGDRRSRLIVGNEADLIWAPEGPGWNWKQPDGWYPAWSQAAAYGVPPLGFEVKAAYQDLYPTSEEMTATGLCSYLSDDGTTVLNEPLYIWRLPVVDEIVGSLVKRGHNAGCIWNGEPGKAECEVNPDKETPLWAPDAAPIYYWAAEELDQNNAWYVSYSGSVHYQPKGWSNSRHSYRCVREP